MNFLYVLLFGLIPIIFICVVLYALSVAFIVPKRENAKKSYLDALEELKQNPNDPDLREKAVELGRKYSGVPLPLFGHPGMLFSEEALIHDINRACAQATTPHYPNTTTSGTKCPKCGSLTKLRTSKKDGSKFHVCVNYPECKSKVAFDDEWEEEDDYNRFQGYNYQKPQENHQSHLQSPGVEQRAGLLFKPLGRTATGTAYCMGCCQTAPMSNLLYCKEHDIYFHQKCLEDFDFSKWK